MTLTSFVMAMGALLIIVGARAETLEVMKLYIDLGVGALYLALLLGMIEWTFKALG